MEFSVKNPLEKVGKRNRFLPDPIRIIVTKVRMNAGAPHSCNVSG